MPAPTLAPDPAPPHPLEPLGGAVVDAAAPTFAWEGVPGARAYRLQLASDRQFTQDVVEVDAGRSTRLALHDLLPVGPGPLFWRVRAETPAGPTRWSPYGRFVPGTDDAVETFRLAFEREAAAARKDAARRRAEEAAARDLVPPHARPDLIPSDTEVRTIGLFLLVGIMVSSTVIYLASIFAR